MLKIKEILLMSFSMGWEMLWALVLGFTLSAIIQTVVSRSQLSKWLGGHDLKSLAIATLGGAVSSSCSYAAAAIARSLVKQGADFTAAMAFQFASTNLVLELGILLALLLGWQFTLAQFVGGIIMIVNMSLLFRLFLPANLMAEAIAQAKIDKAGKMEGHAAMDMAVESKGSLFKRIVSPAGKTAISHYYFMDWSSLWTDICFGVIIASILSTCLPETFWTFLLCKNNPHLAQWVSPLIGPFIAVLSFVCSIGNVPMAAVLWQQGMSFGGVLSFLFADLLVLPLLNIYRKYYGAKTASFIAISFYISMVIAAYCCQWLFTWSGLIPQAAPQMTMHHGQIPMYTNFLNVIALILTTLFFKRFYQTGGIAMLKAMDNPTKEAGEHCCH